MQSPKLNISIQHSGYQNGMEMLDNIPLSQQSENTMEDIIGFLRRGTPVCQASADGIQNILLYWNDASQSICWVYVNNENDAPVIPHSHEMPPDDHFSFKFVSLSGFWLEKQTEGHLTYTPATIPKNLCFTFLFNCEDYTGPLPFNGEDVICDFFSKTSRVIDTWTVGIKQISTLLGLEMHSEGGDEDTTDSSSIYHVATDLPDLPLPNTRKEYDASSDIVSSGKKSHPRASLRRSTRFWMRRSVADFSMAPASTHYGPTTTPNRRHTTAIATETLVTSISQQSHFKGIQNHHHAESSSKLVTALHTQCQQMKTECSSLRQQHASMQSLVNEQIAHLLRDAQHKLQATHDRATTMITTANQRTEQYRLQYEAERDLATSTAQELQNQRKVNQKLVNKIIEERGNIRVFVRVRPDSSITQSAGVQPCVDVVPRSLNLSKSPPTSSTSIEMLCKQQSDKVLVLTDPTPQSNSSKPKQYEFDTIFGPEDTQTDVGNEILPFVQSVVDGYNVCIFAYGQTGSGKTYTMEGTPESPGVNYIALGEVFHLLEDYEQQCALMKQKASFNVTLNVLEIYNETARDLLNQGSVVPISFINGVGATQNLTEQSVNNIDDIRSTLAMAAKTRTVSATNMNSKSSRSHCVITVRVSINNHTTGFSSQSRLVLIDLAGSERIAKSGVTGIGEKEATNINMSLTTLNKVIHALQNREKSIPFRESKLTMLLADCLGGDSKCLMFCNVSPNASNFTETISSLEFAKRASETQLGKAQRSQQTVQQPPQRSTIQSNPAAPSASHQKQIKSLTEENNRYKERTYGLEQQCDELKTQVDSLERDAAQKARDYQELLSKFTKIESELQKAAQLQQRQERMSLTNTLSSSEVGKLYDQQRRSTLQPAGRRAQSSSDGVTTTPHSTLRKRKSSEMTFDGVEIEQDKKSQRTNSNERVTAMSQHQPQQANARSTVLGRHPPSSARSTVTGVTPLSRRPPHVVNTTPRIAPNTGGLSKPQPRSTMQGARPQPRQTPISSSRPAPPQSR